MRKIKEKILLMSFILVLFMIPSIVLAAGSASGSAPASIENGSSATFKVNISNVAAWNVKLTGSGATNGCTQSFVDVTADGKNTSKTFSVTCKSKSEGTITFTASGDITSDDGTNTTVSITKTVNVTKPREKDSESRLSSLSVEGYSIDFEKDKTSYSITVDPTVDSITISAKAMSNLASVKGTGTMQISEEGGTYTVSCIAENGSEKTYTINVTVKDDNPISIKIDGVDYTVVKTNKVLTAPSNTIEEKINIQDIYVPCYTNQKSNIFIVGVKDTQGNIKYAIYDNDNYKLYNENKSENLLLYISEKDLEGYTKTKVNINNVDYTAYEINDRFKLVYAMNLNNGEYNYYKYDTKEKTFQYFETTTTAATPSAVKKEKSGFNIFIITTIIFGIISIGLVVYTIISKKKNNSKKEDNKTTVSSSTPEPSVSPTPVVEPVAPTPNVVEAPSPLPTPVVEPVAPVPSVPVTPTPVVETVAPVPSVPVTPTPAVETVAPVSSVPVTPIPVPTSVVEPVAPVPTPLENPTTPVSSDNQNIL